MLKTRRLLAGLAVATATLATASAPAASAMTSPSDGGGHATIIGGHDATETYPWNVSWGESFHECGGALIAPGWVLSAAHCTLGSRPERIVARIGSPTSITASATTGEIVHGASWVKHPTLDLALLKLTSNAHSPVAPVAPVPPIGSTTRIIGWGRTDPSNIKLPINLQELDVKISDADVCNGGDLVPGKEFCSATAQETAGACPGDSGGPEIAKVNGQWALIGITSRGPSDCGDGGTIYGDVSQAAAWINQVTGSHLPVPAPLPTPTPTPTTTPAPAPTTTTPAPVPTTTTPAPVPTTTTPAPTPTETTPAPVPSTTTPAPVPTTTTPAPVPTTTTATPTPTPTPTQTSGDPVVGSASASVSVGARAQWRYFSIPVPDGKTRLTVTMSGGTGDADLYVLSGGRPTETNWDCRPYRYGNNEVCTISYPDAGTYGVGLRAFQPFSGVKVTYSLS